jgi:hypothetical protein
MSKLTLSPLIKERENKRWDWISNLIMPREQAIVCSYVKCGKVFSVPIELTVRANGSLETYYACPHCFSRVCVSKSLGKSISEAPLGALKKASKGGKNKDDGNCAHFLGYLKTRPKDVQIPDECLTCSRILKCM